MGSEHRGPETDLAHGREDPPRPVLAAVEGLQTLDSERARSRVDDDAEQAWAFLSAGQRIDVHLLARLATGEALVGLDSQGGFVLQLDLERGRVESHRVAGEHEEQSAVLLQCEGGRRTGHERLFTQLDLRAQDERLIRPGQPVHGVQDTLGAPARDAVPVGRGTFSGTAGHLPGGPAR